MQLRDLEMAANAGAPQLTGTGTGTSTGLGTSTCDWQQTTRALGHAESRHRLAGACRQQLTGVGTGTGTGMGTGTCKRAAVANEGRPIKRATRMECIQTHIDWLGHGHGGGRVAVLVRPDQLQLAKLAAALPCTTAAGAAGRV